MLLALCACLLVAPALHAVDRFWAGGTMTYNTPTNWTGGLVPTSADNAINDSGTNNVVQVNTGDPAWSVLDIRAGSGTNTAGAYLQAGPDVTAGGWFRLGQGPGSTGVYTLQSGTMNVNAASSQVRIGEAGAGVLNITGGLFSHQVSGVNVINIGDRSLGAGNSGTVNHSGGILTSAGEIWIGNSAGGTGPSAIYNLSGTGVINLTNWFAIARNGSTGILNMAGGTINKGGTGNNVTVGTGAAGNATINQTGGTINNTVSATWLGEGGTANWNMNGGVGNLQVLQVGYNGTGKGMLNLTNGTISTTVFTVGGANTAQGYINQYGGTLSASAADVRIGGNDSSTGSGAVGIYNLFGGSLTMANNAQIGAYGHGQLNVNGRVTSTGGYPDVGRFATGFGILDINGGGYNANLTTTLFIIGEAGNGTLNIRNGGYLTNTATATANAVSVGHTATGVGTVNLLTGGTLHTLSVGGVSGSSTFNFDGGLLQARGNNATFMSGFTSAYVRPGGANIDVQGFSATIPQLLAAPPGNGVLSIPVLTGGAGYVAAPIVKITGGSGTNASAVAQISSAGALTNILVISPGANYLTPPTVTLLGGLPTTAATLGAAVLAPNASGGLRKLGSGTLTLNGANTYDGLTAVASGVLAIGHNSALGTVGNGTVVSNGAAVRATSSLTVAEPFNLYSTAGGALSVGGNANLTLNGNINLAAGTTIHADGGSSFTINGNVTGSNTSLTNDLNGSAATTINGQLTLGSGLLDLRGATLTLAHSANSWSGGTLIEFGTLQIGNGGANGSLGSGTITDNGTLAFNSASDFTISDIIQGVGGLTKSGPGKLTLNAANLYSGPTVVNAGTFVLTGSISNSAQITVAAAALLDASLAGLSLKSGQTLAGKGGVKGDVTAGSGAMLSPGPGAGTLYLSNNLVLNGGATNLFDLALNTTEGSGINDELVVAGNITLNGLNTLAITPISGDITNGRYVLIRYTGTLTGGSNNLTLAYTIPQPRVQAYIDTSVAGEIALVTILGPAFTQPVVTSITTNSATVTLSITDDAGNGIDSWGTAYGLAPMPTSNSTAFAGPGTVPIAISNNLSGLTAGGHYYVRGWASNTANGIVYSLDRDFYAEPFPAPAISFQNVSNSTMTVGWTPGPGSVGAVVVMRENGAITWVPVDGSNYTANAQFGAGADLGGGTYAIYSGAVTSVNVSTLKRGTNYTVAVYSYAGSGALINYQQLSPATTTQSTATNLTPDIAGDLLVEVHASRGLTLDVNGAVNEWANYGSVGGSFRNDGDTTTYPSYGLSSNRTAVIFDGGDRLKATFTAPKAITGVNSNNTPEDYSVEYWVMNPAIDSEEWLIGWSRRGTSPRFAGFGYGTNNAFGATAHWATPDMAFGEGVSTPGLASTPAAGLWHHIVATYDGAIEKVYVDGVLNAQETKALNIWDGDPVTLGWALSSALAYESTPFSGSVVGIRIHSQALTPLQIANNYSIGPDGVMPVTLPRIMGQPISRTVSESDTATFSVSAVGADPLTFQWYRNGAAIPGANARSYTTDTLTVRDSAAQFSVTVSNYLGNVPNVVTSSVANLTVLSVASSLTHRWPFDTDANDVVGTAHGTLMNGATISGGAVLLNNPNAPASSTLGQFVDLPNNLVMTCTSVTFEAWYTENGNGNWARIWDFGNSSGSEGFTGTGTNYLMCTVPNGADGGIRYGTRIGTAGEQYINYVGRPTQAVQHHVVVTHDGVTQIGRMYIDGALVSTLTSMNITPASLGATFNDWLGRSQFSGDAYFNGAISEFRTYNTALTAARVQQNFELGPNTPPNNGPVVVWKNPANATTLENRPVTFVADVNGNVPMTFQWFKNSTAIPGATNLTVTFSPVLADNNAQISLRATNVVAATTYNAASAAATLTVLADTNRPVLLGVNNEGSTALVLTFSEPMAATLATNVAQYSVTGPGGAVAISGATMDSAAIVRLTTAPLTIGAAYTLSVTGLTDMAATPNLLSPNPTVVTFTTSPYFVNDIGQPGTAGHLYGDANGYSIVAGGNGVGGGSDQFTFAWQQMTGDFDIQVRLASIGLSDTWACAGLMARETLDTASRFAASLGTPTLVGSYFQYRLVPGAAAQSTGNFPANYPNGWLRLKRAGAQFSGYASYDGSTWVALGTVSISTSNSLYVGLAVSSHASGTTSVAFRDIGAGSGTSVATNPDQREPLGPSSRRTGITISEIMYNPAARNDGRRVEFVELFNSNPFAYDLSGHRLAGDVDYTFPQGTTIAGGGFLVIASVPADVQAVYGISGVFGPYTNTLKQSGTVRLRSEIDAVLLEVNYNNSAPWPAAADGAGHSLVLARPSYGEDDPRAWDISESVGGSPGTLDAYQPSPLRDIVINEVLANTDDPALEDYVELYNHSNRSNDLSGCVLTDNASTNKFRIPNGTVIQPRGFVVFTQTQLGFGLKSGGDTIYLKNTNGTRVLDTVRFDAQANGISLGRWPDGGSEFYLQQARTPGAANAGPLRSDIVINELMYNPISGSDDDQYIELYNRGTNAVNIGGWKFTAGVSFTFPGTVMVPPDGYVVVGANALNLRAKYTNLNTANSFGNFGGKLSHNGERVALARPEYNVTTNNHGAFVTNTQYVVVEEVTYGTGGKWGAWADGGGSSLERIDAAADGRFAPNWADSDEFSKSAWTTVEWSGVLDNGSNYDPAIDYAQIGVLDAGEALVDNIEILPGTNGANYVSNGDFESGATGWLFQGDHVRSSIELGAGYGGSGNALHLRTGNRMWTGVNAASVALNNTNLVAGQVATLRFKARWLRGWPEVLLRLHGNWAEAAGTLPLPTNLGTPGARNSRAVVNAGPAVFAVTHQPSLPAANQPVTVIARVSDPDGVASLKLNYRLDPATNLTSVDMLDDGTGGDAVAGDGVFTATIPAQSAGALVAFTVTATDSRGASSLYPALLADNTPARECLVRFGEPTPPSTFGLYHAWISATNINRWNTLPTLSNEDIDMTLVYGPRVIYNAGGRYGGSPYHQPDRGGIQNGPTNGPCHYIWTMPGDDKLLGSSSFNKIAWPGNDIFDDTATANNNDSTLQREVTANTFLRGLGQPWVYRRFVGVYVNGGRRGNIMEDALRPNVSVPGMYYPGESGGSLYKIQPWFEFAQQQVANGSTPWANKEWAYFLPYYTTNNGVVSHKTPRYRWHYEVRETPGSANNYTNVFRLVETASANTVSNWVDRMSSIADMENWMRLMAANHAAGNWDCWGVQNAQNIYGYVSPTRRWTMFMFDFNIVLGNRISWTPGQNLFATPPAFGLSGADTNWATIMVNPTFRRMYLRALQELANGAMSSSQADGGIDARYRAFIANGLSASDPSALKSWIASARVSILSQVAQLDSAAFSLGALSVNASNNAGTITGFAPVAIDTITVDGLAWNPNWLTPTSFSLTFPVGAGTTTHVVRAYDRFGNLIAGSSNQVQVVNPIAPEPLSSVVLNEIMVNAAAPDAEYVEVFNTATNTTFDLSGWQVNGLSYTFPQGSKIAPRSFIVLAHSRTVFADTYGVSVPVYGTFSGNLQSDGETLSLVKPGATQAQDVIVNRVRYEAAAPWPSNAVGQSLQLIDASQDNSRSANWAALTPTPGAANATNASLPAFPTLWLNEVEPDNQTGLADALGHRNPWLEIYNGGSNTVSLDNLYLTSSYTNLTAWAFPSNVTLNPGQYYVVWCDGEANESTPSELHTSFRLPSGSGSVALTRLVAGQPQVVDYLNYGSVPVNNSYGDFPNGQPFFRQAMFYPTPGATNDASLPPVVLYINEWMASNTRTLADPADGHYDDWFELYNPNSFDVNIGGWALANSTTNTTQYIIPSRYVVPANGYLLVWADNEAAQNSTNRIDLHCNFKLSKAGEIMALFSPDRRLVDSIIFGAQTNDVSQGRSPDGGTNIAFFTTPTPRAPNYVNHPPVIAPIADQFIAELSTLTVTASASDADAGQTLTWSLLSGPAGSSLSGAGVFAWTPAEADGPGSYTATIRVADNGVPSQSATQTFNIFVGEVNTAPVLGTLATNYIHLGETASFTATATDSDVPLQSLAFSLDTPPAGASITSGGLFTWTPSASGSYGVVVRVSDSDPMSLSATGTAWIVVAPGAKLGSWSSTGGTFTFSIPALPGRQYQVYFRNDLSTGNWQALGGPRSSSNGAISIADDSGGTQRFYKVEVLP